MTIRVKTERLLIRNFRSDDWRAVQNMAIKAQDSEYAIYDHKWPTSDQEIKATVDWFAGGDRILAVCLRGREAPIGLLSLAPLEENDRRTFELGFRLHADYQGRGYATEGAQVLLEYAFETLDAQKVTAGTAAANGPSRRLLERLGMQETGRGRASFQQMPDGEPIVFDSLSCAISRETWLTMQEERETGTSGR